MLNDIHFTMREIDVMACIMSARRTSKIASILFINSRTVETHIRNIMLKLECNSQEGIIDFIEASNKLHFLRKYYTLLRLQNAFEKSLSIISKLTREKGTRCFLTPGEDKESFISYLIAHLKRAGIQFSSAALKKEAEYTLFILPKNLTKEKLFALLEKKKQSIHTIIFITQENKNKGDTFKEFKECELIDFSKQENYYFSFFDLLKKLIPSFNFDKIIFEFKEKYKTISLEKTLPNHSLNKKNSEKESVHRFWFYTLLPLFIFIFMGGGFLGFQGYQKNPESISLRSDLVLPKKSILLDRSEFLEEIERKLNEKEGIQTVALVGVGGAGKTTLARQFAHHQKEMNSIWEINAETPESLNASFEKLAYALAKTDKDKKELRNIQGIRDSREKEKGMIQFVKERLCSQSNWLLLYDNVVTFADIQKYFPYDSDTWGQGKVILTTRDRNIENNEHVDYVISVGELNPHQKLILFTQIMTHESPSFFTAAQSKDAIVFLESIPSFPLDVSLAAYYLKATNISYSTYLKNLEDLDKDFTNVQQSILRETGEYSNVRYCIITSSLRKILETHPEFEELLLFMMMLNSQEIPRDLLNSFKNDILVSDFIFNLKKYSFLTSESSDIPISNFLISIHRSTQAIGLSYFFQKLRLERSKEFIKFISKKFINYIDQVIKEEDLEKMKFLRYHSEAFLKHKKLLTPEIEGIMKGQLGIIYYFLGDDIRAKYLFEESLFLLDKFYKEHPTRVALFIGYLGNVARDLGDYHKAKILLEKSISIYEKYYPQNNLSHADLLVYLGGIERRLGHYDLARNAIEKGIAIHKKYFPKNENYAAWAAGHLAILDRKLGHYEKAKNTLETSLKIFKKNRVPNHLDIAWALENLGVIYTKLGHYEKARKAFKESLKIYAFYFPDQIGLSWIIELCGPLQSLQNYENVTSLFSQLLEIYKVHFHFRYINVAYPLRKLGSLERNLGNYEKAIILLKQSLSIYQKNYGEDHLTIGHILSDLGYVYLLEGKLNDSEDLLRKSLKILEKNNHSERFACLEKLSDLFLKKSILELEKGNKELAQDFREQALFFLKKALKSSKIPLGKDTPLVKRLEEKLQKFSELCTNNLYCAIYKK
ncbi:MAG TPA: tetratricopeptide repeat protein [Alphaproteobacteria bacterium]|nr:tetratricopeptide repeat protein [Alphaproteobacteria bacterium]HQS94148.1 tetratricopeptide repeat protein [Alphaproteobacteria bacterium]